MISTYPIITIIATSGGRTEALLQRAIPSVLSQCYLPQVCIVVDDNNCLEEEGKIERGLRELQKGTTVDLRLVRNSRTHGFSGSGAWNTGIGVAREYVEEHGWEDAYITILDDDDCWHRGHLSHCAESIPHMPDAIFCNLTRVYDKYEEPGTLKSSKELTIPAFLYGNPGVQGSNMCFRLSRVETIDGFDESLRSCTDRDLMIRFLERWGNSNIIIVDQQTVWHDARSPFCVTNNSATKTDGLDTFYRKHLWRFDEWILERSLARAERLFSYPHQQQIWEEFYEGQEIIAIVMPLRNRALTIRRAVQSVLRQQGTLRKVVLFIGNDASADNWQDEIADYCNAYHNIIMVNIQGGSPAKARNALTEYILRCYPHTYILCRLDADDELLSTTTLSEVEQLFEEEQIDAVLCGNYQVLGGKVVGINRASQLFHDSEYMKGRLLAMARGDFSAELPSCNLCLRPRVYSPYTDECSGEDHWLLVQTLLRLPRRTFLMASQQLYCRYSLNGESTQMNKVGDYYMDSRKRLYEYYTNNMDQ